MRTIEKKQETRTFVEETITCDLCKRLLESAYTRYDRDNQVTIEAVLGDLLYYPDCEDDRDVATLDCCGSCFTTKVRPCLETHLGVRFRDSNKSDVE